MSLLGSIGGALKGAIGGLASGGFVGAGMGAVQGAKAYSNRKSKGHNAVMPGMALRGNLAALPSSNTYSASGAVNRNATPATFGQTVRSVGSTLGMWPTTQQLGLAPAAGHRNPAGGYDANGWPLKANGKPYKRYRSMNPLNGRAARRAIRRIKGARKMLMQIERQLPKARSHSTRTRAK